MPFQGRFWLGMTRLLPGCLVTLPLSNLLVHAMITASPSLQQAAQTMWAAHGVRSLYLGTALTMAHVGINCIVGALEPLEPS